ncbi:MAG: DUF554 domain-containing protein [Treponema sp.]|nr:DUF554 domain-containing protein [Treponema sp.]
MIGLGTIINGSAIVAGGLLGLVAGRFLKESIQKIISVAIGLSVVAMSLSGIVSKMLVLIPAVNPDASGASQIAGVPLEGLQPTAFTTRGTYVIIFALVLGGIIGELIDIDAKLEKFGEWLKRKSGSEKDATFVNGFVTASLTVCVGAMAVAGSIMDGTKGDYSILLTKSIMDFVIIIAMTATNGKGAIFSAIPVVIFQGAITLFSRLLLPVLTDKAMDNLSLVGSVLILCVGVNIIADGKFKIKVANFLPALIFAVAAAFIPLGLLQN